MDSEGGDEGSGEVIGHLLLYKMFIVILVEGGVPSPVHSLILEAISLNVSVWSAVRASE